MRLGISFGLPCEYIWDWRDNFFTTMEIGEGRRLDMVAEQNLMVILFDRSAIGFICIYFAAAIRTVS